MSKHAWAFIVGVMLISGMLLLLAVLQAIRGESSNQYVLAGLLLILATGSQLGKVLYKSQGQAGQATSWYTPLLSFMFAGVLVLPPAMLVALVVIPHLAEWAVERARNTPFLRPWYIQPFNIATHIICSLLAWEIYVLVVPTLATAMGSALVAKLMVSAIAGLVYLIINHYLIGQAMVLVCNITWVESGVLNLKNALADAGFLLAGIGTSLLMQLTPLVVLPMIMLLIYLQRRMVVSLVRSIA